MFSLTPAVRNLLFINIAMLAVPELTGRHEIFTEFLGLHFFNAEDFSVYQLVTHMFMHSGFMHLFFNMLGLVFFGSTLERLWGANRFLIFYFVCGIGAGLLYLSVNYFELKAMLDAQVAFVSEPSPDGFVDFLSRFDSGRRELVQRFVDQYAEHAGDPQANAYAVEYVKQVTRAHVGAPMIGASGAVFGILMAFGLLFPNTEMFFFPLPIPIKAIYVVGFYGITALYGALHRTPGDNVAHYAHIGGMIFGWIMVLAWRKKRDAFY